MTPAEEDALVEQVRYIGITEGGEPVRLAIRAAVAQERERAAYICDRWSGVGDVVAKAIAAAIRKGE